MTSINFNTNSYIVDGDPTLVHRKRIGGGGYGTVHEVSKAVHIIPNCVGLRYCVPTSLSHRKSH
jgi:hypothetical protein